MARINCPDQRLYYYVNEETIREVTLTLEWTLNSLGWFLDHAGSKDHVDRWQEAYDPKGAIRAVHSALVKLKEASQITPDFSIDELKKVILKQDFLLDKIMSVCIDAGTAADNFSEHACRELLKDIFKTWCEVSNEHKPLLKVIWELEYEDMVKRNKKEVS